LTLAVDVHTTVVNVPVSEKGFSYVGSEVPVVYGVEVTTELFGQPVVFSILKKDPTSYT
jgi:hypothetical protein